VILMRGELRRMATHVYVGQFIKLEFSDLVSSISYETSLVKSVLLGLQKQRKQ